MRVLYIQRFQFGTNAPSYNNCRYLRTLCDLEVLSLDMGRPQTILAGMTSTLVYSTTGRSRRFIDLIRAAIRATKDDFDLVVVSHFPLAFLIPLLGAKTRYILDIRTGGVSRRRFLRILYDAITKFDAFFYGHVSIISEGLRDRLHFRKSQTHVIPLGADELLLPKKSLSGSLRLLYVGTLYGRRIEDTIRGLHSFLSSHESPPKIRYDIFGGGFRGERESLQNLSAELGLAGIVNLHGRVPHTELLPFFEQANIGVSYVPLTPYFDVQPPTKTFEYLLAGMPTLATATAENRKVVEQDMGVLIQDTPSSFADGLREIHRRALDFDSENIRKKCSSFTWTAIIEKNMYPFWKSVVADDRTQLTPDATR